MKHANKFILLCTLCLFLSCSLHEVESDSKNSSMVELSPSPVLDRILGLGILKENIKEFKDYYLAEGDIIFLKCDTVIPDSSHLRQRRHKYLVTQKGIQVYLDAEFGWEEYSSPALDQALKAFNDIHSSIFFSRTYDRSQANIIISDSYLLTHVAESGPPSSTGRPFGSIKVDVTLMRDDNKLTLGNFLFIFAHELGHTIGLMHTNSTDGVYTT